MLTGGLVGSLVGLGTLWSSALGMSQLRLELLFGFL